jgi:hypothetical protein
MKINLLPYSEIDGIRTATDSEIMALFTRTQEDELDKIVFYEGTVATKEQFLNIMKHGENLLYLVLADKETVGYAWLNRFENRTARYHFCAFVEYWGDLNEIAKSIMNILINMKARSGEYLFDLFTGYIPVWNQRAIKFTLKNGGKSAGIIPNAIWNAVTNKSEDAEFIYYIREDNNVSE